VHVIAQQGALDGESLSFDAIARGHEYRYDLHPLLDRHGRVVEVTGRAHKQEERMTLSAENDGCRAHSSLEPPRFATAESA
jgi:hypothetical protein